MKTKTKYTIYICIGILVAVIYLFIPVDIIADTIPIAGWIDDAVIILAAIANAIRLVVKLKSHSRK